MLCRQHFVSSPVPFSFLLMLGGPEDQSVAAVWAKLTLVNGGGSSRGKYPRERSDSSIPYPSRIRVSSAAHSRGLDLSAQRSTRVHERPGMGIIASNSIHSARRPRLVRLLPRVVAGRPGVTLHRSRCLVHLPVRRCEYSETVLRAPSSPVSVRPLLRAPAGRSASRNSQAFRHRLEHAFCHAVGRPRRLSSRQVRLWSDRRSTFSLVEFPGYALECLPRPAFGSRTVLDGTDVRSFCGAWSHTSFCDESTRVLEVVTAYSPLPRRRRHLCLPIPSPAS